MENFLMIGHGTKFPRRKEAAIAALLSERSIQDAARVAGVGVTTLLRWLKIPEFRDEWLRARREVVAQATGRLQQAAGAASVTILKLMTDPNVPPAVRVRAAECVFNYSFKGLEAEDYDKRLAELEEIANQAPPTCAGNPELIS